MIDQAMGSGLEGGSREQVKRLPLKEVLDFNNPEIKKIFSGPMIDKKLEDLEKYLEKKDFSFGREDWERMMEIIYAHSDFLKNIKDDRGVITESKEKAEKMENIYFKFPELLLALYFKNKTEVDYRELKRIFQIDEVLDEKKVTREEQKKEISKKYSTEKIENFIKIVENSLIIFKEKIKEIRAFYREIKDIEKINSSRNIIEKINILAVGPCCLKEYLEEMFEEDLIEFNKNEVKKIIRSGEEI